MPTGPGMFLRILKFSSATSGTSTLATHHRPGMLLFLLPGLGGLEQHTHVDSGKAELVTKAVVVLFVVSVMVFVVTRVDVPVVARVCRTGEADEFPTPAENW